MKRGWTVKSHRKLIFSTDGPVRRSTKLVTPVAVYTVHLISTIFVFFFNNSCLTLVRVCNENVVNLSLLTDGFRRYRKITQPNNIVHGCSLTCERARPNIQPCLGYCTDCDPEIPFAIFILNLNFIWQNKTSSNLLKL